MRARSLIPDRKHNQAKFATPGCLCQGFGLGSQQTYRADSAVFLTM